MSQMALNFGYIFNVKVKDLESIGLALEEAYHCVLGVDPLTLYQAHQLMDFHKG